MKFFTATLLVIIFAANVAFGALTVLEDFNDLDLGTINMQHEITEFGFDLELWKAQANTNLRYDSTWANVIETGTPIGQCLELVNRDRGGELDTVYACMYLGDDNMIANQGTIYMQYKADGPNDCILGFNDNYDGYESDIPGDPIGDESFYQGTINYSEQSALVRLGADQNFRARHDDSYLEVDMEIVSDQWYELWIQFDVPSKSTRYYICRMGEVPEVVINPDTNGEWWGWRNDSNIAIYNMKFFIGNQPTETRILVNRIAVAQEYTLESLDIPLIFDPRSEYDLNHDGVIDELDYFLAYELGHDIMFVLQMRGYHRYGYSDLNGDDVVDISDFLIFKANYGKTGANIFNMGDLNRDEVIDISDFLIFKSTYGNVYNGSYPYSE